MRVFLKGCLDQGQKGLYDKFVSNKKNTRAIFSVRLIDLAVLKGLKSDVTQNILHMTKTPLAVGTQTKLGIKCGKGHSAKQARTFHL